MIFSKIIDEDIDSYYNYKRKTGRNTQNIQSMKKTPLAAVVLIFFLTGTLYADNYQWDLVNALVRNDFQTIENILKENVNTMQPPDKRLVMNFTLVYSRGENTLRVIDLLQAYDIQPNSFDVYTAINRNQPDAVVQLLLRSGAAPNGEILLLAMERQRFDLAKQFIESGIDVNYQYPLSRSYADGMTPLLYASKWNNLELAKMLVESGAEINARASDGNTALSLAQNGPVYQYLLEQGAVETGGIVPPEQNTGIAGILDSQTVDFQKGTYRLSGSNVDIRFLGADNYGTISYTRNGRPNTGFFRIENNSMTIIIDGITYRYTIDSAVSFSGNGEVWVRIGS